MTAQPDICRNRHGGNQQSREANDSIVHLKGTLRQKVLSYISGTPSTCEEVEVALSMPHTTASARIAELKALKLIRESGKTRQTHSRRNAAVLEVVPEFELTAQDRWKTFKPVEPTLRTRLLEAIARYGNAEVDAATGDSPKPGIERAKLAWKEVEELVDRALNLRSV